MKNIICFALFSLLISVYSTGQDKDPKHKYPKINGNAPRVLKWDTTTVDFGKIPQGVPATAKFIFTNTGDKPVVLTEVHPTCSCTSPDYTRTPIDPGKTGYVIATYNAAAWGVFNKSLAITTDAGEIDVLVIKGQVIDPATGR